LLSGGERGEDRKRREAAWYREAEGRERRVKGGGEGRERRVEGDFPPLPPSSFLPPSSSLLSLHSLTLLPPPSSLLFT
jgi:hypothetical protein